MNAAHRPADPAAALATAAPGSDRFGRLPLPVLLVDAGGGVTEVNASWSHLTGLSRQDSLGSGWIAAIDERDADPMATRLRSSRMSSTAGMAECRVADADGPRWTRWWWRGDGAGGLNVCVADIDEDKGREAALLERAIHDPLTRLFNRNQFMELLTQALRHAAIGSDVAVLFIDLDNFKEVNDLAGHHGGDRVLQATGDRIRVSVRPTDIAARVGGDEFAILCMDIADIGEAESVADRVLEAVREPLEAAGWWHQLDAAVGVALGAGPGDEPEDLLARADRAMYQAKRRRTGLRRVTAQPEARSPELGDDVVRRLQSVSMSLEACAALVDGPVGRWLEDAIDQLEMLSRAVARAVLHREDVPRLGEDRGLDADTPRSASHG